MPTATRKSLLFYLLVMLIVFQTARVITTAFPAFTQPVSISRLTDIYNHSAYQPQNEYYGMMQDDELYTLAGYRYLTGSHPAAINFELQPLTKYIFGLAVVFFRNAAIVQPLFLFGILGLTYVLGKPLVGKHLSLIPLLVILFDPLVRFQLSHAYLDLSATFFFLLFLFVFSHCSKKLGLIGLTIGLTALAKSFTHGLLVFGTVILVSHPLKPSRIKQLGVIMIISFGVYVLGYGLYWHHHSVSDFIDLHLQILKLYAGYVPEYPKGEIFRIIFFGEWRKWFDDYGLAQVGEWWLFWPLGFLSQVALSVMAIRRKLPKNMTPILVFSWLYVASISSRLVFPRYLIPLNPLWGIFVSFIIASTIRLLFKPAKIRS
jgi:hypothetical protein